MSTANKLLYLGETKSKIKDVANMTGAGIDNNTTFRNYAQALYDGYINVLKDRDTLLDNMPKLTSTGSISEGLGLPVYEDKMSKLSTQETTQGNQLIGILDGTYSVAGASMTFKDGVVTGTTITTSSSFGIKISLQKPITLNANQPYTRSNGRNTSYPYLTLYDINSNVVDNMVYADNGVKTYTPDTQKEIYYVYLWYDYRGDYIGTKPMMNTGSTIKPFEKYTNGPSPNPSYPQEVKTVKGYRNLFDIDNVVYKANNSATVTYNNKIFTIENSSSNWGSVKFEQSFLQLKPSTTYIISAKVVSTTSSGGSSVYIPSDYNNSGTDISGNRVGAGETSYAIFTTPSTLTDTVWLGLYPRGANETASFTDIMIVERDTLMPYVPYGTNWVYTTITDGTNTKNIPLHLNNNEIAGIGDYKDQYIIDKTGHCYLQKNTRKLELAIANMNNYENYPGWNNVQQINVDYPNVSSNLASVTKYLSNICIMGDINTDLIRINTTSNGKTVFLAKSVSNLTQSEWKENYPNLVLVLYYGLATPELIDLNYNVDLTLYEGINNITNSEDMDMAIKYIKNVYE